MAGFADRHADLEKAGIRIAAASVDAPDKAGEVADEVPFPVGHSVGRQTAEALGSFWEDRRGLIQPSEFILDGGNKVVASSYSDGPLGRFDASDVLKLIAFYDSRK